MASDNEINEIICQCTPLGFSEKSGIDPMSHPHSALQFYHYLVAVEQTYASGQEFVDNFLVWLRTPRDASWPGGWNGIMALVQPTMLANPARESLYIQLGEFARSAQNDPSYDWMILRVAEIYELARAVRDVLLNDNDFEAFMRSFYLDDPSKSAQDIQASVYGFIESIQNENTRQAVKAIVAPESMETAPEYPEQGLDDLDELEQIIGNDALFDNIKTLIRTDRASGCPWEETAYKAFAWADRYKPEVASRVFECLVRMSDGYVDNETLTYEEYVQKTFLDNGGKEYLDGEADRAQLEAMFGNLSMTQRS